MGREFFIPAQTQIVVKLLKTIINSFTTIGAYMHQLNKTSFVIGL